MPRKIAARALFISLVFLATLGGVALALTQITREVPASVNVQVKTPDGIEVYLDPGLTQVADSLGFGDIQVDAFGTVSEPVAVPVWIHNRSYSKVELSLSDDFEAADVTILGEDPTPILQAGEAMPVELVLVFHQGVQGNFSFTIFFNAEGPIGVATPTPVPPVIEAPLPQNPFGSLKVAVVSIPPGVGLGRAQAPVEAMNYWGVGEAPFTATRENPVFPMLVTAFTLDPDLSGRTLTIREGVQFHGGFGEMTAEDVAWSMNDANAAITPDSIHGQAGDFAALFGSNPWIAMNSNTVAFEFSFFDPRWNSNFLNESAQALSIFSTAARDQMGEDWLRDHIIATGPFQVVEWIQDTQAILEKVPYTHWRHNAEVDQLTFIEVTSEATRIALLSTGEVDAASVSLANSAAMVRGGFATQGSGLGVQEGVFFSGNLWETVHGSTGQLLDLSGHYVQDLPWIGNPRAGQHQADFPMDDLEQARLVRQALARSVDRNLINEVLLNGRGWPNYVEYFDITNPRWQSQWEYPFDPDEAESLLDQAGFPRAGGSGTRFEMPFYIGPELGGGQGISGDIGDAIAGFWQDIGISVPVLKYPYSVFRPTIVARANTTPWLTSCDEGKSTWPWDWPKGLVMTSLTRGGFGCGIEDPTILQFRNMTAQEPDPQERAEINDQVAQYLFDQALAVGFVVVPDFITYNPHSIESWEMSPGISTGVNDFENIVLAPR